MSSNDDLIRSNIRKREITYYLTSESDLNEIKSKNGFAEIFTVLFSLTFGTFISVLISKYTVVELTQQILQLLNFSLFISIIFSLIFAAFAIYFYLNSNRVIKNIKSSGAVTEFQNKSKDEDLLDSILDGIDTENDGSLTYINQNIDIKDSSLKIFNARYVDGKTEIDVKNKLVSLIRNNKIFTIITPELFDGLVNEENDKGKLVISYGNNSYKMTKEFHLYNYMEIP